MLSLPDHLRLRGWKLSTGVAIAFLCCARSRLAPDADCSLLCSDLPEIRALETYRPTVVTEIYADDGQMVASFALQRRILMTYEQCPEFSITQWLRSRQHFGRSLGHCSWSVRMRRCSANSPPSAVIGEIS